MPEDGLSTKYRPQHVAHKHNLNQNKPVLFASGDVGAGNGPTPWSSYKLQNYSLHYVPASTYLHAFLLWCHIPFQALLYRQYPFSFLTS
jgi:hypothetical protein